MKNIDLSDILDLSTNGMKNITKDLILEAMREACEQTVELCKENLINRTIVLGEGLTNNQIAAIENTKTQIK